MSSREKILFIAKFFPPIRGGSTRLYEEIYGRFVPGSVTVVTQRTERCECYDAASPLRIQRTEAWGDASLHPKFIKTYGIILKTALRLAKNERAAHIHCDTVLPAGLIGMVLSRMLSIPFSVYAHGEEIELYRRLFPEKRIIKLIYRHAAAIMSNSQFTYLQLVKMGVEPARAHLIHSGVDTAGFQPGMPKYAWGGIDLSDKRVLLTVGRLEERKGHDQVIRALPRLLAAFPNLVYVIAGTGKEESRLKQLSHALGVDRAVQFLGFVPDADLPALYNLAELFVMPNREGPAGDIEGFGIVFIEAAACGKPVIAGRSGGAGTAVLHGETGLLVDGNNLDELCEAILLLLNDEALRRRFGANGRKRAVEEFDWEVCLQKIQAIDDAVRHQQ